MMKVLCGNDSRQIKVDISSVSVMLRYFEIEFQTVWCWKNIFLVTCFVLDPPDNNPKIHDFETNKDFSVIESGNGTFVCSTNGGNSLASLSWNCFGSNDTTIEIDDHTVTSTVKWTANRRYNTCSCQAHHRSNWKRISKVTVNVQCM